MVAAKNQITTPAATTRRGPSTALVNARAAAAELATKFSNYRKSKNEEVKELKTIGLADAIILTSAGNGGAAFTGAGRGIAQRFDVDQTYVDVAMGTLSFLGGAASAYFDFMPGVAASIGCSAPITADLVQKMVAGKPTEDETSELDE